MLLRAGAPCLVELFSAQLLSHGVFRTLLSPFGVGEICFAVYCFSAFLSATQQVLLRALMKSGFSRPGAPCLVELFPGWLLSHGVFRTPLSPFGVEKIRFALCCFPAFLSASQFLPEKRQFLFRNAPSFRFWCSTCFLAFSRLGVAPARQIWQGRVTGSQACAAPPRSIVPAIDVWLMSSLGESFPTLRWPLLLWLSRTCGQLSKDRMRCDSAASNCDLSVAPAHRSPQSCRCWLLKAVIPRCIAVRRQCKVRRPAVQNELPWQHSC